MKSDIRWNISIIPLVEYVHPSELLTAKRHSLRSETAFEIGKKSMELGFYMTSTCFATQIVSINLLN